MCDGPSQITSLHAELASDRTAMSILDSQILPAGNIYKFSIQKYNIKFYRKYRNCEI